MVCKYFRFQAFQQHRITTCTFSPNLKPQSSNHHENQIFTNKLCLGTPVKLPFPPSFITNHGLVFTSRRKTEITIKFLYIILRYNPYIFFKILHKLNIKKITIECQQLNEELFNEVCVRTSSYVPNILQYVNIS